MKKLVLTLLLCSLFVVCAAWAGHNDLSRAERTQLVDEATAVYERGANLTDDQSTLLRQAGIIRDGNNELDEAGGPDLFGYMYIDSQEPGGPVYLWDDIMGTGTMVDGWGGDVTLGPFPIGFDFPYYENTYDEFYVCDHGYVCFGGNPMVYWGVTIPHPDDPNNEICFAQQDWLGDNYTAMYYETIGETCVIQIDNLNSPVQVILHSNGDILIQYHTDYVGPFGFDNGETIGIENSDGTDGLLVSQWDDPPGYPFGELALLFYLGEENASVSGFVTEDATGDPVVGADVHFGGYMATTDGTGYYEIDPMYPRAYDVTIDAIGYYPYHDMGVEIVEGANTYDASLMLPGNIEIDLGEINLNAPNGEMDSQVLTISNTGDSPLMVDLSSEILDPAAMGLRGFRASDRLRDMFTANHLTADSPVSTDIDAFEVVPCEPVHSELDEPYVLIFNDGTLPWGSTGVQDYLDLIGVDWDLAGEADLATWDLEPYTVVIILSEQQQTFYDEFVANHDRFEDWVDGGGWLQYHGCTQGQTWTMFDGLAHVYQTSGVNWVIEPDHPICEGIPESFTGSSANHDYLINLPENALTLINDDFGNPVLIEYEYGGGTVIVTTETWEFAVGAGQEAANVMYNCIDYTTANAGQARWLSYEPRDGVIAPGDFLEITVTGDASDEEVVEGTYEAILTIESDDPDNMMVDIPVTFLVGEPQVILTATPVVDPTIVDPPGFFLWDAYVENISGGLLTFDAWTSLTLPMPWGVPYGPLPPTPVMGITLIDGGILAVTPAQVVPGIASWFPGTYTYHAVIGDFMGGVVLAEATFTFDVVPTGPAVAGTFTTEDWVLTNFFELDETGVVENSGLPTEYSMENAYPNPFNPTTTISVGLPENALMKVTVHNVIGQEVAVLANGAFNAGYHNLTFNAANLSSGIYFVQASVPGKMDMVQKVMLMK